MRSAILSLSNGLHQAVARIAVLAICVMFFTVMIQIIARYVFNYPLGWTDEVSVLCWIWTVLWGAAFVLRERDEVRFDIFYSALGERTRCVLTVITGVAVIVLFGMAAAPSNLGAVSEQTWR